MSIIIFYPVVNEFRSARWADTDPDSGEFFFIGRIAIFTGVANTFCI